MIVNFNRQTGNILGLTENLDSFNTKTVKIKDVSLIKYLSLNKLTKVTKEDKFNKKLFVFNNKETSIIDKIQKTKKGDLIFSEGNIKFYTNGIDEIEDLKCVKVYDKDYKYVSFPKEYKYFNIDEIMREYYQLLLEESECLYGIADNFSYLKNILIGESTFKTIEDREIVLGPGNELKLKSETLKTPASIFRILDINRDVTVYINSTELDTIMNMNQSIDKVNISFKNNTNKDVILDSFMIGYGSQE